MIKLFNQSIAGLSLAKTKNFIRASFLSGRPKSIGSFVAGFVVVGALLLMLNPAAADNDRRKLDLRVYFTEFHATKADPTVNTVGDQFTYGGTLARFESPDQQIGTFGVQFVRTSTERGERVGFGTLNLPDGLISFTAFLDRNPRVPGPITGGTGVYWNARGQIDHQSLPNGVEEFILTFVGN